MATINSLPLELLARVLDLSYDTPGSPDCYKAMWVAALVPKTWSTLASQRLWRNVFIQRPEQADALARSPGLGMFRTETLTLRLLDLEDSTVRAIGSLRGMLNLEVWAPLLGHRAARIHARVVFTAFSQWAHVPHPDGTSRLDARRLPPFIPT